MKKPRIYVDTSVIGGCLDEEFAEDSNALLEMAKRGDAVLLVSDLLLDELRFAPPDVSAILDSLPSNCIEVVKFSSEAYRLRDQYLAAGVVGPGSADDALHVALATLAGADLLGSWNFKHIVHYDKVRKFNGVNLAEGYPLMDIVSPPEIV